VFLAHASIAHVRTSVVLDRVKQTGRLPLKYLAESAREEKGKRK